MPSNNSSDTSKVQGAIPTVVQKEKEERAAVVSLAVRLLTSGEPSAYRIEQVSDAVKSARALIAEAGKSPQIHASELFRPHQLMSMKDIASVFKENDWPGLTSEGSVKKRTTEILSALHRDIQRRSNLLSSAFQQIHRSIKAEAAEREATRHIRELLEKLGMSSAFGEGITQVATQAWQMLLEQWLSRVLSTKEQIEQTRDHRPEFFDSICQDLNYTVFCASHRPSPTLCSDELLNLGLWLEQDFRNRLKDDKEACLKDLDGLVILNNWPEWIFPNEQHLAKPFAAFLSSIEDSPETTEDDLKNFEGGIIRLSMLISRMRMKELSERLQQPREIVAPRKVKKSSARKQAKATTPEAVGGAWVEPLGLFKEIRSKFWALTEEQRASLDDTFSSDMTVMAEAGVEFLTTGRLLSGMAKYPYRTYVFRNPLLKTYATNLDSLLRYFEEQDRLFTHLGVDKAALAGLTTVAVQEMETIKGLIGELESCEGCFSERLVKGRESFQAMALKAPSPGRILPHLLFAYARGSKSLDDPKLKDLLYHRSTT